ncbi:MAG: beta-1,6-N-acetylglucosaminyltransferase [Acetobacteraceae bacterium]|nr:beta-1,6-N-acetylglucosaminyltransferase [Acetobacteraceae bacterium]
MMDRSGGADRALQGLAALILAHDNVPQLALLLRWLGRHGARSFVHLDARAHAAQEELARFAPPRCTVLPPARSFKVAWGGFGMVEATLALMREALNDPATRHLALLSGTHLPLRPAPEVASFLFDGREHIDLGFAAAEPMDQKSLRRFWYHALPGREEESALLRWLNRNSWRLGKRDLARGLRGMTPMVGTQWWCLTAECARHVLDFVDANPWYPRFFRFSSIPDETFFHTIIGASPFTRALGSAPLYQRMAGYSPMVLRAVDLPAARASGMPFARKFDSRVDAAAVELALFSAEAAVTGRRPDIPA